VYQPRLKLHVTVVTFESQRKRGTILPPIYGAARNFRCTICVTERMHSPHTAKSKLNMPRRTFTAILTALFVSVFCLTAVCDLSCNVEQSTLGNESKTGNESAEKHSTAMIKARCLQCRHCREQTGFSPASASNQLLSNLDFYKQTEHKLAQITVQSRNDARIPAAIVIWSTVRRAENLLESFRWPTVRFPGPILANPGALAAPLKI
jgi:hypothetical protein